MQRILTVYQVQQIITVYKCICNIHVCNFNEPLNNDKINFEQLGPGVKILTYKNAYLQYSTICRVNDDWKDLLVLVLWLSLYVPRNIR